MFYQTTSGGGVAVTVFPAWIVVLGFYRDLHR